MASPKSRRGIIKNQDVAAATFVVGKDPTVADFISFQEALNNIPPEGGSIGILQGDFDISATLDLPAAPVKIIGSGREVTTINLGSNAIAAFTLASDHAFSFSDFTIVGDNSANQIGLFWGAAHFGTFDTTIDKVRCRDVETFMELNVAAFATIRISDCRHSTTAPTGMTLQGAQALLFGVNCNFSDGGFLDDSDVHITNSVVQLDNGADFNDLFLSNCPEVRVVGAFAITPINEFSIVGCRLTEVAATRFIDVPAGAEGVIANNNFDGAGSAEDIQIAATNITVSDNVGSVVVTEIAAADSNRYANNAGFAGSTIIGPFSVINGMQTGSYTGDGTTGQVIALGLEPRFVKIWERATVDNTNIGIFETTPEIMDDNASGGNAQHTASAAGHRFRTNQIITLGAASFTVDDNGVNANPNTLGVVYNFLVKE